MARTVEPESLIVAGGLPRVILLPPEVLVQRRQNAVRKVMFYLVGAVLVAVVLVFGFTYLRANSARADLVAAQAQSQSIVQQQSKFAHAKVAETKIAELKQARTVVTSSEVLWSDVLTTMTSYLPAGGRIQSATITGRGPWETGLATTDGTVGSPSATIAVTIDTAQLADVQTFVTGLQTEKFVASIAPSDVTGNPGQYATTITVVLNSAALSKRFPSGAAQ